MPITDEEETGGENDIDTIIMQSARDVVLYSNLDYFQALQLPFDTFYLMRKNYIIEKLSETEAGRGYLDKCKRLQTTEIDRQALKQFKNTLENKG